MTNNNYYTPSIEEFHVGSEYEQLEASDAANGPEPELSWVKKQVYHGFGCFDEDRWALEENEIRVKYLDKEDIEELGFENKYYSDEHNTNLFEYAGVILVTLSYNWDTNLTNIISENTNFKGVINNKSELKQVLKMLNISYED